MSELPTEFRGRPPVSAKTLGSIRTRLVARLAPEVLNPFDRTPEREATLRAAIGDILADPELDLVSTPAMVGSGEAAVCGLGPLQPLVDDPEVADILVNEPGAIFAERAGRLEPTDITLASADELIDIAQRIAALAGRELSVAHPIVDARMPDGSRVNAVIPPVGGPYLAIRKFNRLRLDLMPGGRHGRDWVTEGGMNPEMADFLARMVRAKANVLVAGEIRLPKEAFYTLQALHTGHDGSATTIHASSAEDALFRLELLARQSMRDLTVADLRSYIARVFDLVLVLRRLRSGRRIVRQIAALDGVADGDYRLVDVFKSVRTDGGDGVTWESIAGWQPPERLASRMELEA